MALGKYAVDYEMRVDYDRLRKERLQRAKDRINKDGLGAIVTWDEANVRYMTAYYITTPNRPLEAQFAFCARNGGSSPDRREYADRGGAANALDAWQGPRAGRDPQDGCQHP